MEVFAPKRQEVACKRNNMRERKEESFSETIHEVIEIPKNKVEEETSKYCLVSSADQGSSQMISFEKTNESNASIE